MSNTLLPEAENPSTIQDLALRDARKELLRDLAEMMERPTTTFLSRYLLTLLPITVAAGALVWFEHPAAFVLFAIIAGFTQNALGVLMHEGSHHFFHRDRKMNDLIANVLVCLPIFNTVQGYRSEHFDHHRHSGKEIDPYHDLYGKYTSPRDIISDLAADIVGLTAVRSFLRRYVGSPGSVSDAPRWTILGLAGVQAVIALILWQLTGWPPAWLFLWVLPLMTIPIAINRMRTIVEHYPGFEALPANRTTFVGIVEYLCVSPYGYSHHFEHHFAPNVPYYRLGWAHSYLKARGISLRAHEYNSAGYLRTFRRMITELNARSRPSR